jgi:branched-chain amino acid transport system substrate-binding protein
MKRIWILSLIASSALAASTVKIGVQAPITGAFALEGQGIVNAVKLLVQEQNAKGGLLGHPLQVIVCDDEGQAAQAAICARQLVDDGVFAVVGSYSSTATEPSEPIYFRAGILQTSDATADSLTQHGYWTFFRNFPPNSAEAIYTAHYLVDVMHYKRIAILSDHSSYSEGLGNQVEAYVKKDGGHVVYRGFITAGAQNFTPVLTKVASYHPDVIYFSGYYSDGGLLRAQEVQLGIKAAFVGGDANDNVDFARLAGKAAAGSYIINVPLPQDLPYPEAKAFLAAYHKAYGSYPPSIFTLSNADGLRAIFYAVEQTKSLNARTVAHFLHHLKDFPGITGPITFSRTGERLSSPFETFELNAQGAYTPVYPK